MFEGPQVTYHTTLYPGVLLDAAPVPSGNRQHGIVRLHRALM